MRWFPILLLTIYGCGPAVIEPNVTGHPLTAYEEVPYPPPAALAETVPPAPRDGDVAWIDGEWMFQGDTYVWKRGGWVDVPEGARFAPWHSWYRRDGRLMLARGTWYDHRQRPHTDAATLTNALTPPNEVTPEFQTGR